MENKNTASTSIRVWPGNESYFRSGLSNIFTNMDDIRDILFVNLSFWNVKEILRDDLFWQNQKKIVIISNPALMPLATHWFYNHDNIMLVIDSTSPPGVIQSVFEFSQTVGRLVYPHDAANRIFDDFEIDLIKRVVRGQKAKELASLYDRKQVTIYNIKRNLANDLGLRKLEQLILPACTVHSCHPRQIRSGSSSKSASSHRTLRVRTKDSAVFSGRALLNDDCAQANK